MQEYTLIRSKKRRRSVAMKISPTGEIIVRAPVLMPKFMIDRFVREHESWIIKQKTRTAIPSLPLIPHLDSPRSLEDFIKMKVKHYSTIMNLFPARLRFRNVRSYWGSCSPAGVISFNHHLLYAPREAVEYVIVHELAHLKYRGHGIRFWDLVRKYYPRANEMRRALRQIPRE